MLLFFVMCQNNNKEAKIEQVFPSDTIPMQFNHQLPRFCLPILDGIVNDTLHFEVFLDTGTQGKNFYIPNSFKDLFDSDSAFIQIGRFKKRMGIHYWGSNQQGIINIVGRNTIMVGWQFFENTIIEFDFQNQHILVYDDLPDVTEYSKTNITVSHHPALLIPAEVVIQGKKLQDTFNIDTGCNNYMVLSTRHIEEQVIDTTNALYNKSTVSGGSYPSFYIHADSIKIGDLNVAKQFLPITFRNDKAKGLLGTRVMENFNVILDLVNYDLYLKKIDS